MGLIIYYCIQSPYSGAIPSHTAAVVLVVPFSEGCSSELFALLVLLPYTLVHYDGKKEVWPSIIE